MPPHVEHVEKGNTAEPANGSDGHLDQTQSPPSLVLGIFQTLVSPMDLQHFLLRESCTMQPRRNERHVRLPITST